MRRPAVALSACLLAALPGVGSAQTYSSALRNPVVAYPAPYLPGCFIPMPAWAMRSARPTVLRPRSAPVAAPVFAPTPPDAGAIAAPAAAVALSPEPGGEPSTDPPAPAAPPMIGGLLGDGRAVTQRDASGAAVRTIPLATRGAFEVSENESPRPTDRAFTAFDSVNAASGTGNGPAVYRGLVGFEKTFLDGNASFGLRAPMAQSSGSGAGIDGFGDLSLVGKYAFVNDAHTGTVASGGLVVTAPTGRSVILADGGKSNPLLLQPWVGGILALGDAYALGFTSIIASSEDRDPTLYNLDLGLGYRLYQSQNPRAVLSSIIPTVEGHLTTALGNNPSSNIQFGDPFIVTGGVHFGLFRQAYFTVGAAFPVSGGRGNDFDAIARFNYQF